MAYSFRTLLEQIPHFVLGFGLGIVVWKWMGKDAEENIVGQLISHIGMALGYRYARSKAQTRGNRELM
jgi:hypothetical protein